MELNLGKKYGIHIASILRGKRRINIPGGSVRLFPMDKIQVIGTDEQLNVFSSAMQSGAKLLIRTLFFWVKQFVNPVYGINTIV